MVNIVRCKLGQYVEFSEAVGLIFTKNESEYPKTERGGSNPEWAIAHEGLLPPREVFGYSLEF